MKRQRGMVLLPVTLALALVGTLAYAMTRDGVMNVATVDAQYEIDRARYLAEAGVNLLKWRNEQAGCGRALEFTSPVTGIDGGTISASDVAFDKGKLALTVTATTARGTVNQVVFDKPHGLLLHDQSKKVEITVAGQGGADTFLRRNPENGSSLLPYLETSEGNAHALVRFDLSKVPPDAMIVDATLRLYLDSIQSTQSGSLGVHRMLRAWPFLLMGWSNGWTNPGGDFAPQPSATIAGVLAAKQWYTAPVDALAQSWIDQPSTNLGLLLKPASLVTARFTSFEASGNQPQIFLRYYPRCK
jgi:hypothetical protein